MTDPTEAEARAGLLRESLVEHAQMDVPNAQRAECMVEDIEMFEVNLRATEREKVRALVKRLADTVQSSVQICHACGGLERRADITRSGGHYIDHTAGCPWVEARLWLDGGVNA